MHNSTILFARIFSFPFTMDAWKAKKCFICLGNRSSCMFQNCLLILRKNWSYVKKKVDTMLALYLLEGDVGGFC